MARRMRHGLDYFPLDTSWDLSMRLLKAKYGLEGLGTVIQLMQMIYREGYYIEWSSETRQLFCAENQIDEPKLNAILEFCLGHGLFNQDLFKKYSVLTSQAIQRQWIKICLYSKHKNLGIDARLNLCPENSDAYDGQKREYLDGNRGKNAQNSESLRDNFGDFPDNDGDFPDNCGKFPKNPRNMQEIGTEIKEKENKEKKSTLAEFCAQPVENKREIQALIKALAQKKSAFPNGPPGEKEPSALPFQRIANKERQ